MCATFTDGDIGKPVERADGKVIGTVASLEEDRARVEPKPDVVDQLLVRFDRAEIGGPFVIDESDVRQVSETRVHLVDSFSRTEAEAAAGGATGRSAAEGEEGDEAAAEASHSDGGATANANANATADTADAGGLGADPLSTTFQKGAAALSAVFALAALFIGWSGYQGTELAGNELSVVSGAAGLMLLAFFAVVALVAAVYMEPGFDH